MRGILFTEYQFFLEAYCRRPVFDLAVVKLGTKISGSYTSVGNYSYHELLLIHGAVCDLLSVNSDKMAKQFGQWILTRFTKLFPDYFRDVNCALDFLEQVGSHIHIEVKKLYPDSNPPEITLIQDDPDRPCLIYRSHRGLVSVAHGMVEACLKHFDSPYEIDSLKTIEDETRFQLKAR